VSWGVLEGGTIRQLSAAPYANGSLTGRSVERSAARLLAPADPRQVIAVGLNYVSHLGERPAATYPGLFAKMPNSITGPDADIVYPADAENLHSGAGLGTSRRRRPGRTSSG
jgi:2-keto-4-pentenoate hydratase/2-oxohepta-3-ene-1,7-dioic acid hydratase in catechol pathway